MLVAVPAEVRQTLIERLDQLKLVRFVDMRELGRNPNRIIPAITEFAQEMEGHPCRFVGQPTWAGRTTAEMDELARCEILLGPALSQFPVSVLTVYQTGDPLLSRFASAPPDANVVPGRDLTGILSEDRWPLGPLPGRPLAEDLRFERDLSVVRSHVRRVAERAGIQHQRIDDLVLAVNEVASNSTRYGGGGGLLRTWGDRTGVVCELRDAGTVTDPLVGLLPPGPELEAKGLWLVNQVCDLVQIRSGPAGTTVRIRLDC